jgi:hypothetical protein
VFSEVFNFKSTSGSRLYLMFVHPISLKSQTPSSKSQGNTKLQGSGQYLELRFRCGERTRLACRFRRLAEIRFSIQPKKVVGEAPRTAREGACAPRKRHVVRRVDWGLDLWRQIPIRARFLRAFFPAPVRAVGARAGSSWPDRSGKSSRAADLFPRPRIDRESWSAAAPL